MISTLIDYYWIGTNGRPHYSNSVGRAQFLTTNGYYNRRERIYGSNGRMIASIETKVFI